MLNKFFPFFILLSVTIAPLDAQDSLVSNEQYVQNAIIKWADSTLKSYSKPHFENFVANYTDEYLIKKMRTDALDKSIERIEKSYKKGTYKGSDVEYNKNIQDLENKKKEALNDEKNYHPKVTSYTVSFWSTILLDSGVYNHFELTITLNDYYEVVKHRVNSSIDGGRSGRILYK